MDLSRDDTLRNRSSERQAVEAEPAVELFGQGEGLPGLFQRALGSLGLSRQPIAQPASDSEMHEMQRQQRRKAAARQTTATYRGDRNPNRRLRHASWKGDLELARTSVEFGASVEAQDDDSFTPVLIASRWNRLEMLRYLVDELQADVSHRNRFGDSALNLALQYGHSDIVEYLVSIGCVIDDPSSPTLRKAQSANEWLRCADRVTPTADDIKSLRVKVHEERWAKRARTTTASAKVFDDGDGSAGIIGEHSFRVGQKVVRKAPRI
jgi:hypothetical protein